MRGAVPTLACVAGLVLQSAGADAETWTILQGKLTKGSATRPLSGSFDASLFEPDPPDGPSPVVLTLDDFAIAAGRRQLAPAAPIEYQGLHPIAYLELADAIQLEGDQVTFLKLRTGGRIVAPGEAHLGPTVVGVTYRFLDLRADASDGGRSLGHLGDTALPRRLWLKGDVYEVEQSFLLPVASCSSPPPIGGSPGGGGGGGGVIIGTGGAILSYGSFEIGGRRTFEFQQPGGSVVLRSRTSAGLSQIEGGLDTDGSAFLLNPAGVVFDSSFASSPLSVPTAPTLEQLGVRAPAGADISLDSNGALRVASTGDLFVEGTLPGVEIPGLTSVTLTTPGRIVVTGHIVLPGLSLRLVGEEIQLGGQIDVGSVEAVEAGHGDGGGGSGGGGSGLPDIFCHGLQPILPAAERLVGHFSLVASAARQVEIDVSPGAKRNRVYPGSLQTIQVALLGSRSLDVGDVDLESLRLGSGDAEPLTSPEGARVRRLRANSDRHADLLAFFGVREAEVAFGDRELCLVAETHDGELLEGCDRIDTRPVAPRR